MSSRRTTYISPEEYLAQERLAERKSEYFQGEVFAMSGASGWHVWIVANLMYELGRQPRIEHWTRQRDNHWDFVEVDDLAQSIQLTSIGCILPLVEVYDKIEWAGASSDSL